MVFFRFDPYGFFLFLLTFRKPCVSAKKREFKKEEKNAGIQSISDDNRHFIDFLFGVFIVDNRPSCA